jgi:PQQ enzyme repeat
VSVPDFTSLYTTQQQIVGGALLLSDTGAMSELTLRLYDVFTGKDRWKMTFSAGSIVMRSLDPDLTGVVDSRGAIRILRLANGKVVTEAVIDPKKLEGNQTIHLLSDDRNWYLAMHKGLDVETANLGGVLPNVPPGSGFRSVPVHGYLYAIERDTGKVRWYTRVEKQHLLLEEFQASPVVILASRHKVQKNGGQQVIETASLLVINKSNGKLLYDKEATNPEAHFHAVNVDPVRKRIDLISVPLRVTLIADAEKEK